MCWIQNLLSLFFFGGGGGRAGGWDSLTEFVSAARWLGLEKLRKKDAYVNEKECYKTMGSNTDYNDFT